MQKTVRIFVAGSKELKSERNALKAVAQDLNTRYKENAIEVSIVMKSWEHFKDRQSEYNSYISEYADLVIFILDGKIGHFTKEEYYKAVDAYKKKDIPEILVFLKKYEQETKEIEEIKNLLRDSMGEHFFYIDYDNDYDLQAKAEKRINRFISPSEHTRDTKKWRRATGLVALTALLLISGLFLLNKCDSESVSPKDMQTKFDSDKHMLLFMGGGSVFKYLEEKGGVKIDAIDGYRNSIYMPVATGNLWGMIAEEYHRDSLYRNKYYPLFMAAERINTQEVNRKVPDSAKINTKMLIVEINLGNDSTTIYLNEEPPLYKTKTNKYGNTLRCLNPTGVRSVIDTVLKPDSKSVLYSTSLKSGTFSSFKKILIRDSNRREDSLFVESLFSNERKEFHEHYAIQLDGNPYVILGSVYYHPDFGSQTADATDYSRKYYVLDENDNFCTKDMCLYFCAYKEGSSYVIPKPILDFLQEKIAFEFVDGQKNKDESQEQMWKQIIADNGIFNKENVGIHDNSYIVRFNAELKHK